MGVYLGEYEKKERENEKKKKNCNGELKDHTCHHRNDDVGPKSQSKWL